ncbi:MAG: glycosyltransferase [Burkholderiales bacterium]|nr:glycosyltransferase [Bacteroidia bacterium]
MKDQKQIDTPLLSVCIITYNHINYIRQAIDSVLMQKVDFSWNLIIADDCSKDGTRDILLEYKQKYPELITLILQENNIGAARNWITLLSEPISKYIAYFEGDDYWTDPLKLQKQFNFLEANNSFSSCFHNTMVLKENNETIIYRDYDRDRYTIEDTLGNISLFHTSSFVFRREALAFPSWIGEVRSGDMLLFTIIARLGDIKYLPETMSVYRKHGSGISSVRVDEGISMNENHILRLTYTNEFLDHKYSKVIKQTVKKYKKELFYYTKLGKIKSKMRLRTRLSFIYNRLFNRS